MNVTADQNADLWELLDLRAVAITNERAALGGAFASGTTERIRGFTFRHEIYSAILDAMVLAEENNGKLDLVTVWSQVVRAGDHDKIDPAGLAVLTDFPHWSGFEDVPATAAAEYWLRYDAALKRAAHD